MAPVLRNAAPFAIILVFLCHGNAKGSISCLENGRLGTPCLASGLATSRQREATGGIGGGGGGGGGGATPCTSLHMIPCLYLRGGSDDGGSVGGQREGAPAPDKPRHDWAGLADDPEAMERGLRGVINPKEGDDHDRLVADLLEALRRSGVSERDEEDCEEVLRERLQQLEVEKASTLDAEDIFQAQSRYLLGKGVTKDWTCLRCGAPSKPYLGQCDGCGAPREIAGHEFNPETVEVSVPGDVRCISAALNRTQAGLSSGWNQKYRKGILMVSKGAAAWPWEMLVPTNMTLDIVGVGPGGVADARWWMDDGSSGSATSITLRYEHPHRSPYPTGVPHHAMFDFGEEENEAFLMGKHPTYDMDPEKDMIWSVLDIWGGPWILDGCEVRGGDVFAVATAHKAAVNISDCFLGGIDDTTKRAVSALELAGDSRVYATRSNFSLSTCGGAGVRAMEGGKCTLRGCNVSFVDFGVCVDLQGCIDAEDTTFYDCIWGSFYVGFVAKKTSMRLVNCTVHGQVAGPGWYDERRPGKLVFDRVSVNDTALVRTRDWQEYAKQRFAAGHRDGWLERHVVSERGGEAWRLP